MIHDLGWLKKLKILDSLGNLINPATNEKLEELKTKLEDIYNAVDGLELSVDNIDISAAQINLNTDDLEAKVQLIRDQLDVLSSTRASELTLSNVKTVLDNIKIAIDSINSNFDVVLSTRASEATLIEIRDYVDTIETKLQSLLDVIGEVQATPTQYTLLGRLKDLWDKLHDLFVTGTGKVKIHDGTNTVGVDTQNNLLVAGKDVVGDTPASNPVGISGVDTGGLKKAILTDAAGRIQVVSPTAAALINVSMQLLVNKVVTAINNHEWQEVLEYIIPTGYDFNSIIFSASSDVANETARVVYKLEAGSFDCSIDTFTDGEYWDLPRFASKLYVYVTSAIGSGGNDVITVTYTNQVGTIGRIGTVTIPKNSLIGTRLEVFLQGDDYGVVDITNVTHSQIGQAGVFNLEGTISLFQEVLTSSKVQYSSPSPPLNSIVVPQGGKIYLQYLANSAVANSRTISLIGSLAPR